MADYKFRFPVQVVAIIDLVMTIVSIYLLVMFFFLTVALSSCLSTKDDCSSFVEMGGGGLAKFGLTFRKSSSSSYSHAVINSGYPNSDNADSFEDDESKEDNNNVDEFRKPFEEFGFDNRNRNPGQTKEVDLNFGSNRNSERNHDSFGRTRNQNQKPSGFEWFISQEPKADFLQIQAAGGQEKDDGKFTGAMRVLFIVIVIVFWIFFAIAAILEIVMLVAAIRLLISTKEGKHPSDALRSANCWRICSAILTVLFVLNFFGGAGQTNLESIVVGGANVLFRVIGIILVSLYIRELKTFQTPQTGQKYYDVGGSGGR